MKLGGIIGGGRILKWRGGGRLVLYGKGEILAEAAYSD